MASGKTRKSSAPPETQCPETNISISLNLSAVPPPDTRPIVISGPSGVGKGTLYKRLFASHPEIFTLSVSHTTRSPRDGEIDGVDYHFVTHAEFDALVAEDGFVEHATFGSNKYGTSKMTIEDQRKKGKVVVLDIEMEVGFFFSFLVVLFD